MRNEAFYAGFKIIKLWVLRTMTVDRERRVGRRMKLSSQEKENYVLFRTYFPFWMPSSGHRNRVPCLLMRVESEAEDGIKSTTSSVSSEAYLAMDSFLSKSRKIQCSISKVRANCSNYYTRVRNNFARFLRDLRRKDMTCYNCCLLEVIQYLSH